MELASTLARKIWYVILLFFLWIGMGEEGMAQVKVFSIDKSEGVYALNQYLGILEDSTGNLEIGDLIGKEEGYRKLGTEEKLHRKAIYWARLQLKNTLDFPSKWVFSPDWEKLTKRNSFVNIYFKPGDKEIKTGRLLPYSQKEGISREEPDNLVLVELGPQEALTLYIQIWQIDNKRPVFNAYIMDYAYWRGVDQDHRNIFQAIFQGIVWIMLFYALLTYWSLKDRTFLYYALFLFSTSLYFLFLSGILFETLLREIPIGSFYVWIFATNLLAVFYFQFARSFLNTKKYMARWDPIGKWFIRGLIFLTVLEVIFISITYNQAFLNHFNNGVILLEVSFLLLASISQAKTPHALGRIFTFGTLCLVVAGFMGVYFELTGSLFHNLRVIEGLFILEMLTFSRGLNYRHYIQRKKRIMEKGEKNRLKELDKNKSDFFANFSHELRTPIMLIKDSIDNLKVGWGTLKKERVDQHVEAAHRNSDTLLSIVNQILDLSKLEAGAMDEHWQHGDVIAFIRSLVAQFDSAAELKSIDLAFLSQEAQLSMDFEPDSLQTVVSNLLSNAIKFTPEGGKIEVGLATVQKNAQAFLELEITDNGKGISQEDLPQIFNRYYQARSNKEGLTTGTGIGLALVAKQVALLKGEVSVKSRLGEGTTFLLVFPIKHDVPITKLHIKPQSSVDASLLQWEVAPDHEKTKKRGIPKFEQDFILLIEDNHDVVNMLSATLENDYRLGVARNGREGINLALEVIPDLIISDVSMPEKNGYEVCETLKEDARTSHIPIILLTGRASQQDRITGFQHGADAFLTKPFSKPELLTRIERLIAERKKLQERYASDGQKSSITGKEKEHAFVKEVRRLIEANLDNEEFDKDALCKAMGMSYTQFHRKLKALTNLTTTLFFREVRLEKANYLLKTADLNVSEVAFEVGFKDPAYFSRVFRQKYGASPNAVRP